MGLEQAARKERALQEMCQCVSGVNSTHAECLRAVDERLKREDAAEWQAVAWDLAAHDLATDPDVLSRDFTDWAEAQFGSSAREYIVAFDAIAAHRALTSKKGGK